MPLAVGGLYYSRRRNVRRGGKNRSAKKKSKSTEILVDFHRPQVDWSG
jgi:hypothetical protein